MASFSEECERKKPRRRQGTKDHEVGTSGGEGPGGAVWEVKEGGAHRGRPVSMSASRFRQVKTCPTGRVRDRIGGVVQRPAVPCGELIW